MELSNLLEMKFFRMKKESIPNALTHYNFFYIVICVNLLLNYSFQEHEMESTIRRILELYQQNTVEVKDHVWDTMRLQGQQEVSPGFINRSSHTKC